uniref:Reverse transcriptase domain-containing protein n=1 Tax=Megaselia scalaris TaxID=36166 RepID=T1GI27_MEGSC
MGNGTIKRAFNRGTLQGGVISPLLLLTISRGVVKFKPYGHGGGKYHGQKCSSPTKHGPFQGKKLFQRK